MFGGRGRLHVWWERKAACLVGEEGCMFGGRGRLNVWWERKAECLVGEEG